jgi:hypothetical protein
MLDTSFLVAAVLVVITLLFYILYWGRFLALLIGLALRVVLWNRGGSSAWIQIGASPLSLCLFTSLTLVSGSFHISLLAGRILLKDFRYHSSNQTFKIVRVQLRWQYWIRSLTHSEDIQAHGGGEGSKCAPASFFPPFCVVPNTIIVAHASKSPRCRFHATFEGFEWFIYNRTAAFDNIVSRMEVQTPVPENRAQGSSADRAASQLRHVFTKSPVRGDGGCITFCRSDIPE